MSELDPVFGRLAGYEDVNDAARLRHDTAMRWVVGGKARTRLSLRLYDNKWPIKSPHNSAPPRWVNPGIKSNRDRIGPNER